MKIAISNIAWPLADEEPLAATLRASGAAAVEVAPTRCWPRPLEASVPMVRQYRDFWERQGLPIVALQALLFGRPELCIFGDDGTRQATLAYLKGMIQLAAQLGAKVLVFGSPRNRRRDHLSAAEATGQAIPFFRTLGQWAKRHRVWLCVEPNPEAYGCDFITTAAEALALVRQVDQEGFGLHLDAGALTLSREAIPPLVSAAGPWLRHVHISEPFLAAVPGENAATHYDLADALCLAGYDGYCSIEMKMPDTGPAQPLVRQALSFAAAVYSANKATAPIHGKE